MHIPLEPVEQKAIHVLPNLSRAGATSKVDGDFEDVFAACDATYQSQLWLRAAQERHGPFRRLGTVKPGGDFTTSDRSRNDTNRNREDRSGGKPLHHLPQPGCTDPEKLGARPQIDIDIHSAFRRGRCTALRSGTPAAHVCQYATCTVRVRW